MIKTRLKVKTFKKKAFFKKFNYKSKLKSSENFKSSTFKYDKNNFVLKFRENSWVLQNEIFTHPEIYGDISFYFIISYKTTNIFYTFLMKTINFPNKTYIIAKASTGFINRMTSSELKNVQRGRVKTNFSQIIGRFAMFRRFCFDFFKNHPNLPSFNCVTIWKIDVFNSMLLKILNHVKYNEYNLHDVYENYISKDKKDIPTSYYYTFHLNKSHGGSRPKKPRYIKKNRKKRMNALLAYNTPEINEDDIAISMLEKPKKIKNIYKDLVSKILDKDPNFLKESNLIDFIE